MRQADKIPLWILLEILLEVSTLRRIFHRVPECQFDRQWIGAGTWDGPAGLHARVFALVSCQPSYFSVRLHVPSQSAPGGVALNNAHRSIYTRLGVVGRCGNTSSSRSLAVK